MGKAPIGNAIASKSAYTQGGGREDSPPLFLCLHVCSCCLIIPASLSVIPAPFLSFLHSLLSFPRRRESTGWQNLDPRFHEEDNGNTGSPFSRGRQSGHGEDNRAYWVPVFTGKTIGEHGEDNRGTGTTIRIPQTPLRCAYAAGPIRIHHHG